MALQYTHLAKGLLFRQLFGIGGQTNVSSSTNVPTLGANNYVSGGVGSKYYIHFYGGTRPDISALPVPWQGTAYTNTTKLWPQSTGLTALNTSVILAGGQNNSTPTFTDPNTLWTIDWTNQIITTSSTTLATNMLFAQGTVTWFAVYGALCANGNGAVSGSTYSLMFTGDVGATGSGADIEINSTTIPSVNYPVELKRLSFQYTQPTGVDLIFSKNIYTTALLNMMGAGTSGNSSCYIQCTSDANAKYTSTGTNRILLYSGTRPATPDLAVPGDNTLISTIDTHPFKWSTTPAATFVNTTSETSLAWTGLNYIGTTVALGTPTWARVLVTNSGSTAAFDCSAGLTSVGTAAIQINEASTIVGQQINLTSIKFTMA